MNADALIAGLDAYDAVTGQAVIENSTGGLLLRFAALLDHDGRCATRVPRIPAELGRGARAQIPAEARDELAQGLRDAALALDAGTGADARYWSAADLARIIGALEQSHAHARGSAVLLELRVRLGRLGLPEGE